MTAKIVMAGCTWLGAGLFLAGFAAFWSPWVYIALLFLACTAGLARLVWQYGKIRRKYQK